MGIFIVNTNMFWTKYSYERNRRNVLEILNLVVRGIGVMFLKCCHLMIDRKGLDFAVLFDSV